MGIVKFWVLTLGDKFEIGKLVRFYLTEEMEVWGIIIDKKESKILIHWINKSPYEHCPECKEEWYHLDGGEFIEE
ncbi:MAG: hypothetical protein Q8P81_02075 [Nanoarchaeota archaeon]|nr:hypothetical protein [Nanoarchaeota archaeon]